MKILIICTGNTCRSQMAEGILKSIDTKIEVFSAGTKAEKEIKPATIKVMQEIGIDLSKNKPTSIDLFLNDEFDYVITVCDGAKSVCPIFQGKVKNRLHIGFQDPAEAKGEEDEILDVYRKVRDEIAIAFKAFYKNNLVDNN